MLRRNLLHMRRYPSLTLFIAGIPVVFLLLFVYVFGGTLGAGLGGWPGGREAYIAYVVPGILLMTVAGAAQGTAISVAMDMTEGIVARFRTMAITRASVLTGPRHRQRRSRRCSRSSIVTVVAVLIGFRPTTGPIEWLAAAGLLALTALAISVALGRAGPVDRERRDRQQPADVPDDPAVPRQRLRARPSRCRTAGLVRREPAVHADHRDAARPADRDADRRQRLVASAWCVRDLGRWLPLVAAAVQARPVRHRADGP